jgi:dihydroorotate dehydrogenase
MPRTVSTPGGYTCQAVLPIALWMCMKIGQVLKHEFPERSLSGIGGIESGREGAQFILLGCNTMHI